MTFARILVGIVMVGLGFVFYPYWYDMCDLLITQINTQFPSLNVLEDAFLAFVPVLGLVVILFCGYVWITGKLGHRENE